MKSDCFFLLACLVLCLLWPLKKICDSQTRQKTSEGVRLCDKDGGLKLIEFLQGLCLRISSLCPLFWPCRATVQPLGLVEWLVSPAVLQMHRYPPTACSIKSNNSWSRDNEPGFTPKHKLQCGSSFWSHICLNSLRHINWFSCSIWQEINCQIGRYWFKHRDKVSASTLNPPKIGCLEPSIEIFTLFTSKDFFP